MAYMYFCGAVISGPWFEFKDFQNYCRGKEQYKDIPSTFKPAIVRFCQAWMFVGMAIVLAEMGFDEKSSQTAAFAQMGPLRKVVQMYGDLKSFMTVYLTGFCLMEVGPIASGLSYNGNQEGEPKHDRVKSVVLWNLEASYKVKDFLANWNISVHAWLKYYVYLRQLDNKNKGQLNGSAAMITFLVSAIWHGFYPGFLHFFMGAGLLDYHSKLCALVLVPRFTWVPDWI